MDLNHSLAKYTNAKAAHAQALEALLKLTRADTDKAIQRAAAAERFTWHRLGAARHELREAILESIGR